METRPEHRRSFILQKDTLVPIPEGFYLLGPSKIRPFLASPLMSRAGKFRSLLERFLPAHPQGDESLASFVRRRFGQEMLERLAQPLLGGIYAADPETLSLRATFPQFLEMERVYGSVTQGLRARAHALREASGARYKLFVTLRGGMQTLPDALAAALGPSVLKTNSKVASLERGAAGWQIRLTNGEALQADALCLALPAMAAADLLRPLDATLANALESIPYHDSATIQFAFRDTDIAHPLDGFGVVAPRIEGSTVMAATFAHRKFEGRAPKGTALVRAFLGGAWQKELLKEDDDTLKDKALSDLKRWLGIKAPPAVLSPPPLPKLHAPVHPRSHRTRVRYRNTRRPNSQFCPRWQLAPRRRNPRRHRLRRKRRRPPPPLTSTPRGVAVV